MISKTGQMTIIRVTLKANRAVKGAIALTDAQAKAAPNPVYVTKLKSGCRQYSVYVHRSVLDQVTSDVLQLSDQSDDKGPDR